MKALHKEAIELYDLYFKPNAKHKIDVDDSLGEEIFSSNTLNVHTLLKSC
jgi:hypothetical protein